MGKTQPKRFICQCGLVLLNARTLRAHQVDCRDNLLTENDTESTSSDNSQGTRQRVRRHAAKAADLLIKGQVEALERPQKEQYKLWGYDSDGKQPAGSSNIRKRKATFNPILEAGVVQAGWWALKQLQGERPSKRKTKKVMLPELKAIIREWEIELQDTASTSSTSS